MLHVRSVNSMVVLDGVENAQSLILQGDIWSWGEQYILSGRTGFPRKVCPPGHIFLADRFSSDTGPKIHDITSLMLAEASGIVRYTNKIASSFAICSLNIA